MCLVRYYVYQCLYVCTHIDKKKENIFLMSNLNHFKMTCNALIKTPHIIHIIL